MQGSQVCHPGPCGIPWPLEAAELMSCSWQILTAGLWDPGSLAPGLLHLCVESGGYPVSLVAWWYSQVAPDRQVPIAARTQATQTGGLLYIGPLPGMRCDWAAQHPAPDRP